MTHLIKLTKLMPLVLENAQVWRSTDGAAFVEFVLKGVPHTVPLDSAFFGGHIHSLVQEKDPGAYYTAKTLQEVKDYLRGSAFSPGTPINDTKVRVGEAGGKLYLDPAWEGRELVEFDGGKWQVVQRTSAHPKFVVNKSTMPLVKPDMSSPTEKLVDMLKPFIHVGEKDLLLLVGWVLGCYKNGGPYPILMLTGEQGSAKSTITRLLRKLVDPHALDIREPTTDDRDFAAAVRGTYILAYDNLSYISPKLSDSLCRIATGIPLASRTLYTNYEESSFSAMRPIILNGIPDVAEREDFVSRVVSIQLPTIPADRRRDDDSFWADFHKALPRMIRVLWDMVAKAQKDYADTVVTQKTRMTAFLQWAMAGMDPVDAKEFNEHYVKMTGEANQQLVEHDLVVQGIIMMMQEKKRFEGSVYDLLHSLMVHLPQGFDPQLVPKKPRGLAERIKRAAPALREIGIETRKGRREAGTGRRCIIFEWTKEAKDRNYTVSISNG